MGLCKKDLILRSVMNPEPVKHYPVHYLSLMAHKGWGHRTLAAQDLSQDSTERKGGNPQCLSQERN